MGAVARIALPARWCALRRRDTGQVLHGVRATCLASDDGGAADGIFLVTGHYFVEGEPVERDPRLYEATAVAVLEAMYAHEHLVGAADGFFSAVMLTLAQQEVPTPADVVRELAVAARRMGLTRPAAAGSPRIDRLDVPVRQRIPQQALHQ